MDLYKLIPNTLNVSQEDNGFCIRTCPKSPKIMVFEDMFVRHDNNAKKLYFLFNQAF
jgi:hypothetical protein